MPFDAVDEHAEVEQVEAGQQCHLSEQQKEEAQAVPADDDAAYYE